MGRKVRFREPPTYPYRTFNRPHIKGGKELNSRRKVRHTRKLQLDWGAQKKTTQFKMSRKEIPVCKVNRNLDMDEVRAASAFCEYRTCAKMCDKPPSRPTTPR